MIVLNVCLDNFFAFKNFKMNLTYPKKIVSSSIEEEHLADRPNFRYKKVNIIMGANASGKTTFGRMLMSIFNFIDQKNYELITRRIGDCSKKASFTLDMASGNNILYRVTCLIAPRKGEKYSAEDITLEIRKENISSKDSYESCIKRMETVPYSPGGSYINELERIESLDWIFQYPEDNLAPNLPDGNERFRKVLENILKALDTSIQKVEISKDVKSAYVIHHQAKSIILQEKESFDSNLLSSGTKAGVGVAVLVSTLVRGINTFYYCDEKFSYVHSDIEKAVLSLMIEYLRPNMQLFFTTHNTDIMDLDLPKHAFTFLRKDVNNLECPITCIDASTFLKRSTDSLKHAVENDLFSSAPALDLIYEISDVEDRGNTDEE